MFFQFTGQSKKIKSLLLFMGYWLILPSLSYSIGAFSYEKDFYMDPSGFVQTGGGNWQHPLEVQCHIGKKGYIQFVVRRTDVEILNTSGTFYLKYNSYETYNPDADIKEVPSDKIYEVLEDNLFDHNADEFPLKYYVRLKVNSSTYRWVGPITIDYVPEIEFNYSDWDLGDIEVNTKSIEHSFTLTNIAKGGVATGNLSVINSTAFKIISGEGPFSIAPGTSKIIKVIFAPNETGYDNGHLFAETDYPCEEKTMFLYASAYEKPQLVLNPPTYDFGSQNINTQSTVKTFTLSNIGGGIAKGTVLLGSELNYEIVKGNGSFSIGEDESINIEVIFKPAIQGQTSVTLKATGDGSLLDVASSITGFGVIPKPLPPEMPLVEYQCGKTVITQKTPPTDITWYWQNTDNGTSTDDDSVSKTFDIPGIYYLRARMNQYPNYWSDTCQSGIVKIYPHPTPPQVSSVTINDGEKALLKINTSDTTSWYLNNSDSEPVFIGSSYEVSPAETTIYYVSSSNEYCESEKIPVTVSVIKCLKADVNKDKEITAQDAVDAFFLSFKTNWTTDELCRADMNDDKSVSAQDAVLIFWESFKSN